MTAALPSFVSAALSASDGRFFLLFTEDRVRECVVIVGGRILNKEHVFLILAFTYK